MSRRALALTAAAALAGCSLIVPLDYTGGTEPSHDGHGGQGGTAPFETGGFANGGLGGTLGEGGMSEGGQGNATAEGGADGDVGGASGGTEPSTGGDTSAGKGGTTGGSGAMGGTGAMGGSGAMSGTGAVSGGGTGGSDASGGMNSGGVAGTTIGGMSGQGGSAAGGLGGIAGMGGMSGTGTAGNAGCPGADPSTDPSNCGSCGHACGDGVVCEGGLCITSPCVGLTCANPPMPMPSADGERYKVLAMGTGDLCYEVLHYAEDVAPQKPSVVTWNFGSPRSLQVNGVDVPLVTDPGASLAMIPERGGGYCVHATAGNYSDAGIKLPLPGELQ